jgi:type IV secretory pathway VirB2 component (pilin)
MKNLKKKKNELRQRLAGMARKHWMEAKEDVRRNLTLYLILTGLIFFIMPTVGYCSVESTLSAIQGKLITTILPLAAILGLVFAGLSFVMGSPNARSHFVLAIIGAVVGFGAPSIVQFIQGLVH